ncbi:MAG: 3-deoxy-D-manno-octulosonic acid transferase [Candidatus Sumerlaeia bacterium]|nr:3-deoxy-D-manno-octulosonic acid transferase [Candidatus Sumerlaeia bacterium]
MNKLTLYDVGYVGFSPVLVPYFLIRYATRGKSLKALYGMLGGGLEQIAAFRNSIAHQPVVWFHAVSVGEVMAATAVIKEFRQQLPQYKIFLSTITETGQDTARRQLKDIASQIFYHPLDLSPLVNRYLNAIQPSIYIIMETEIWPNMLLAAKQRGVKIFMVNGKISDRSFKFYRWGRGVMQPALKAVDAFLMQTEEYQHKVRTLLGTNHNVFVTGNCKFDINISPLTDEERRQTLTKWRISNKSRIIVVGSTHPGEEEIMLEVYQAVKRDIPQLKMVLAPRHPGRFEAVYNLIKNKGFKVQRASAPDVDDPEVVLLDEMGKLASIYGVGEIAIVGGSFVNIGGHNLLEPAAHKIPVIYGPYMHQQSEMTEIMNNSGGGFQVDVQNLVYTLKELLRNDTARQQAGERAYLAVSKNRGSTKKALSIILQYI